MKKWILVLTSVASLALISYYGPHLSIKNLRKKKMKSVRIAFPYAKQMVDFDPQRIQTASEANLARSMYARLFNLDDDGQLEGDLAESFHWDGHSYIIKLRDNIKTNKGNPITLRDVKLSLLRLLIKEEATHGSLKSMICADENVSLKTGCRGLTVTDDSVILTPLHKVAKEFLIKTLASPDFSILKESSVNWSDPSLPIINHFETTGAYYLVEGLSPDEIVLKINKFSHYFSEDLFEQFEVTRTFSKESARLFEEDKIDFIPTFGIITPSSFSNFETLKANVHFSQPIQLRYLIFTQKGRKKLNEALRLKIGEELRQAYKKTLLEKNQTMTDQFFPVFAFGHLEKAQMEALDRLRRKSFESHLEIPTVTMEVWRPLLEPFKKAFHHLKWLQIEEFKGFPWDRSAEDLPDLMYGGTDAGFYEDLSLIHYFFKIEVFGNYKDGLSWIDQYVQITSSDKRKAALDKIHLEALNKAYAIPLTHQSYLAVSKPFIKMEISELFAGTPLWKIKKR
jgi:ABC-type transport system substrate-binding protein